MGRARLRWAVAGAGCLLAGAAALSSAAFEGGETALSLDQRGIPRPQFARDDVGAVEQAGFAAPVAIPSLTGAALGGLASSLALAALVAFRLSRR